MNGSCPTEDRLKLLIKQAFDELPEPDPVRMKQLAGKLARTHKQARPHRRNNWLIGILFGFSVTAMAWWGATWLNKTPGDPVLNKPAVSMPARNNKAESAVIDEKLVNNKTRAADTAKQAEPGQANPQRQPVIDQRELY